jgi:hypothetical protein
MASRHANRANKAEHMAAHRPAMRREVLTCQPGAVHTWHISDHQSALPVEGLKLGDKETLSPSTVPVSFNPWGFAQPALGRPRLANVVARLRPSC